MTSIPAGSALPRQLPLDFGAPLPEMRAPPRLWSRRRPPAAQIPKHRLYLVLSPDAATRAAIAARARALRAEFGLSGPERPLDVLHLTLFGLAAFEEEVPDYLVSAVRQVAARVAAAPFDLVLDRALSFRGGSPRPFVLGCRNDPPALSALREELVETVGEILPWIGRGRFTPHVTLLYDRRLVPETTLAEPVRWAVRDFALVHSLYGESRHVPLGRWPLRG